MRFEGLKRGIKGEIGVSEFASDTVGIKIDAPAFGRPRERGKEALRLRLEIIEDGANARFDEELAASRLSGASSVPMEAIGPRAADLHTEKERRDIFDLMRLIKDHGVMIGDDTCARAPEPHREVGEEEVVVDDDELALLSLPPHTRDITIFIIRAARADARLGATDEMRPERIVLGKVA